MSIDHIVITSMGHEHPEFEISNTFFEELNIASEAQWVEERTGIKKRFSVLSPETIKKLSCESISPMQLRELGLVPGIDQMVSRSWEQLVKRRQEQIDPSWVICGTSVPDFYIPANANLIAAKLNLTGSALDVNTACSSFITNLTVARSLMSSNEKMNSAAIFNVERYTTCLNYNDRRSCVLFGDGSACTVLEKGRDKRGLKIIDTLVKSNSQGCGYVTIPAGGFFDQNGARVQKFAISKTCEISSEILNRNGLSTSDIDYFVGHQANLRMLVAACSKLEISEDKHLFNVDEFGNQGAAGAPVVLSSNWEKFKPGQLILVSVVGSGLTWGGALMEFI